MVEALKLWDDKDPIVPDDFKVWDDWNGCQRILPEGWLEYGISRIAKAFRAFGVSTATATENLKKFSRLLNVPTSRIGIPEEAVISGDSGKTSEETLKAFAKTCNEAEVRALRALKAQAKNNSNSVGYSYRPPSIPVDAKAFEVKHLCTKEYAQSRHKGRRRFRDSTSLSGN